MQCDHEIIVIVGRAARDVADMYPDMVLYGLSRQFINGDAPVPGVVAGFESEFTHREIRPAGRILGDPEDLCNRRARIVPHRGPDRNAAAVYGFVQESDVSD